VGGKWGEIPVMEHPEEDTADISVPVPLMDCKLLLSPSNWSLELYLPLRKTRTDLRSDERHYSSGGEKREPHCRGFRDWRVIIQYEMGGERRLQALGP
jgi:hypothetical protein